LVKTHWDISFYANRVCIKGQVLGLPKPKRSFCGSHGNQSSPYMADRKPKLSYFRLDKRAVIFGRARPAFKWDEVISSME
jgi:hypothetical protein